jgi:hypothetical protein
MIVAERNELHGTSGFQGLGQGIAPLPYGTLADEFGQEIFGFRLILETRSVDRRSPHEPHACGSLR